LYAWRKNLAPIAATGFRVIAFDLPGFGFSDKAAPASGYDNKSYVRASVALLDSLHIADAVLVGHSMGGAIAAQVAIDHPERVRGILREFRFDGLQGQLEHVAAPTLVLWGEEDRIVPIGLGRALALGIPHAAFLSVPHAGHSVQEEAADEVNRLVIKFLREGLP